MASGLTFAFDRTRLPSGGAADDSLHKCRQNVKFSILRTGYACFSSLFRAGAARREDSDVGDWIAGKAAACKGSNRKGTDIGRIGWREERTASAQESEARHRTRRDQNQPPR
jgi:hypothetical protein